MSNKNPVAKTITSDLNLISENTIPWYKNPFYITIFCLSIFRLWLTSDIRLIAIPSITDDYHYVITAYYNKMGQWMGPLDHFTLHLLPFFSVYLAYLSKFKISLLFANHFLYTTSWIFGIFTLRHFIKKDWILIFIFVLVLFQPMTYAGDVCRVVREGMWVPCATFILFCYIRMFFIETKFYVKLIYSFIIGLLVSVFYLTREDGLIIFPLMLFLIASFLWTERKNIKTNWLRMCIVIILPFLILKLSCWNVIRLNMKYYKADYLYENVMKENIELYNLFSTIKQNKVNKRVVLTTANRYRMYELSPTFAQIKPYDEAFVGWQEKGNGPDKGETGHFGLALKYALNYAGYYSKIAFVKAFYKNLKVDIQKLLDDGTFEKIEQHPFQKYLPGIIDLNNFDFTLLISKFIECTKIVIFLESLDTAIGEYSYGNEQTLAMFKEMTNSELAFTDSEADKESFNNYKNSFKNQLRNLNHKFYSLITPVLFFLTLILLFYIVLNNSVNYCIKTIALFAFAAVMARISTLVLLAVSSDIGLFFSKYLSLSYPFLFLFIGLTVGLFIDSVQSKVKTK